MTSHLTLSAIVFAIVSTAAVFGTVHVQASAAAAPAVRMVELERVVIVAPRLVAGL